MNKSKLQEFCQQQSWPLPVYTTVREGPDHNPRFTGTVTVNGVPFHTAAFVCRSSKEAQNEAAKIAYDHFTAPKTILQRPNGASPEPSTGFSASDAKFTINTPVSGIPLSTKLEGQNLQANHAVVVPTKENGQFSYGRSKVKFNRTLQSTLEELTRALGSATALKEDISLVLGNLYKNRLQNYAQKRNIALPMYACEIDGPPHARHFKSRVTINGNTYEAPAFFSTLKDAENAAAQVAFAALPPDDVQEDEGLYKSILQELAQKMGFRFPTYETNKSGPPHMPVFLSRVEVGNGCFQGQESKTKKQAEMSAAKAAYIGLTKGKAESDGTDVSKASQTMGASVITSSSLESTMVNKFLPNTNSICNAMQQDVKGNAVLSNGGGKIEKCNGLETEKEATFSLGNDNSIDNALAQELAEETKVADIAKGQKSPSSNGHLRSPSKFSNKSDIVSETSKPAPQRISVRSRKPNMTYTDGTIVHSDEKWVAVKVNVKQEQ